VSAGDLKSRAALLSRPGNGRAPAVRILAGWIYAARGKM
jgi:hypothetical protein